jgi:protein SMG8
VITNISNNSLFAIPANQEFVYVHRVTSDHSNINKLLLSSDLSVSMSMSSDQKLAPNQQRSSSSYRAGSIAPPPLSNSLSNNNDTDTLDGELFRRFLFQHVDTAVSDGFNDNIGRTNVLPVFELPSCDTWYRIFNAYLDFFLGEPKSNKIQAYYTQIKSHIDIDLQFSENRCKKLLTPAISLYQENLPLHYNKSQNQQRVYN